MNDVDEYCKRLRENMVNLENNPDDAHLSSLAIDGFEKIMKSRILSEVNLSKVIMAAKSQRVTPYHVGTELVLTLLAEFPEVELVWRKLLESNLAHERWVAISVIRDERISFNLAKDLIEMTINDRSSKVRSFAVEGVLVRYIESLVPAIKQRAKVEKDRGVLQRIDWVLSHMEQK